jgi:hypothetical protein
MRLLTGVRQNVTIQITSFGETLTALSQRRERVDGTCQRTVITMLSGASILMNRLTKSHMCGRPPQ